MGFFFFVKEENLKGVLTRFLNLLIKPNHPSIQSNFNKLQKGLRAIFPFSASPVFFYFTFIWHHTKLSSLIFYSLLICGCKVRDREVYFKNRKTFLKFQCSRSVVFFFEEVVRFWHLLCLHVGSSRLTGTSYDSCFYITGPREIVGSSHGCCCWPDQIFFKS